MSRTKEPREAKVSKVAKASKPSKEAKASKVSKPSKEAKASKVGTTADRSKTAVPVVIMYTDGACSGNPGPGGWAAILESPQTGKTLELSGGDPQTTNNRMEMLAVIEGLRRLKARSQVKVVTDSKYVLQGITEWVHGWMRNGWMTSGKKPVKNKELWQDLLQLTRQHDCTFEWVAGHSGHPQNDRADELAVAAYQKFLG